MTISGRCAPQPSPERLGDPARCKILALRVDVPSRRGDQVEISTSISRTAGSSGSLDISGKGARDRHLDVLEMGGQRLGPAIGLPSVGASVWPPAHTPSLGARSPAPPPPGPREPSWRRARDRRACRWASFDADDRHDARWCPSDRPRSCRCRRRMRSSRR